MVVIISLMKHPKGFTLIELLVVIAILTVLSVIGFSIFNGVSKGVKDIRRKADILAMARALEVRFDGSYQSLTANNFASGSIPTPPEGGSYFNELSPGIAGFRVCAALEGGTPGCSAPSVTCYCIDSTQGRYVSSSPTPTPTPGVSPSPSPTPSPSPASIIPNDPYYGPFQWNLPKINAQTAWDISKGNAQTIVALVDTGVKADLPDLTGKILSGYNFYDNNTDTADVTGHGTSVSGVIGAFTNNSVGIASLGWNTPVMPIRVTDAFGFPSITRIAQGITYAADNGAKVINISLAEISGDANLQNAVNYAWGKGAVLVGGAGNNGIRFISFPAALNHVIAVGGTDASDELGSFSNFGPELDVVAPGVGIETTDWSGQYNEWSGTSFATPHVSALAALIFVANPSLTNQQVVDIITGTAVDLGTPGWDESFGCGRINAGKALRVATGLETLPAAACKD